MIFIDNVRNDNISIREIYFHMCFAVNIIEKLTWDDIYDSFQELSIGKIVNRIKKCIKLALYLELSRFIEDILYNY